MCLLLQGRGGQNGLPGPDGQDGPSVRILLRMYMI